MTEIIINPDEGIADIYTWAQHVAASGVSGGGDDFQVARKHTTVAPCSGVVTQAGGDIYNSVILKIDGDSLGRSIRLAENTTVLVKKGQHVNVFDPITQDALLRGGIYRAQHINGMNANGGRTPFLPMVTVTQAQAHALLLPPPPPTLLPNQRQILPSANANVRLAHPTTTAAVAGNSLAKGSIIGVYGFVYGAIVNGNSLWYVTALDSQGYPAQFVWSGGCTTQSTVGITQLQEHPDVTVPPVNTPPVVVTPPVEEPPVVDPPVVTPPIEEIPPVETTSPVSTPPEESVLEKVEDAVQTLAQNKSLKSWLRMLLDNIIPWLGSLVGK